MCSSYYTPDGSTEVLYEIKKSKFIARLCYAKDRPQAMTVLAQAKKDYPDARHHCWAYVIGSPKNPKLIAMFDDGEPSGTAGKPILNVMRHKEVGDAILVVIRYFGGIKLGAGGLVRAYSHATQQAYDQAPTKLQVQLEERCIRCNFSDEQTIRHWLSLHDGKVRSATYTQQVNLRIALNEKDLPQLSQFIGALKNAQLLDTPASKSPA
jgi:uncharacterized YigZ family protein